MHFLSCAGELNHHGRFMCDAMHALLGNNYRRISTSFVNKTRKNLGFHDEQLSYGIDGSLFNKEQIVNWIKWADVVDFGSAPEIFLHESVRQNKVVFIRMERILKEGVWKLFVPSVFARYYRKYIQYRNNKNVYFLCVSAYAAGDLKKIFVRGDRVLQWAYCPEFVNYDNVMTIFKSDNSEKKPLHIFWCGRLIPLKHPEVPVCIAEKLKFKGIEFHMELAGAGELFASLQRMIKEKNLEQQVSLIGSVIADKMRSKMLENDIFIASSDYHEGWGVVINEAMNSGCAVVASREMGSVPVLIEDGVNGYSFCWKDIDAAVGIIENLAKDRQKLAKIKMAAYQTIKTRFSPEVYANVFVQIAQDAIEHHALKIESGLGAPAVIR